MSFSCICLRKKRHGPSPRWTYRLVLSQYMDSDWKDVKSSVGTVAKPVLHGGVDMSSAGFYIGSPVQLSGRAALRRAATKRVADATGAQLGVVVPAQTPIEGRVRRSGPVIPLLLGGRRPREARVPLAARVAGRAPKTRAAEARAAAAVRADQAPDTAVRVRRPEAVLVTGEAALA